MSDDPQFEEIDETADWGRLDGWEEAKQELLERCKAAKLPAVVELDEGFGESVAVDFPCGRLKRQKWFVQGEDIRKFLRFPFEHYAFLGEYEAVSRNVEGEISTREIEAEIRPAEAGRGSAFFRALQFSAEGTRKSGCRTIKLLPSFGGPIHAITVGPASDEFCQIVPGSVGARRLSVRIVGALSSHHDELLSVLERVTDALFFQIEGLFGSPPALVRWRVLTHRLAKATANLDDLKFPETEYEGAPMSLYFYAKGASGLPLVQFLAFYQTIEYHYPMCFSAEARRRVRGILKDPAFRYNRDADVMRILNSVQGGSGTGHVSERAMLRATVHECVDLQDLVRFLNENSARAEFFKSKQKDLTPHTLPISQPDVDPRQAVADRIYDIRCRIVHTKSGDEGAGSTLLLPNSKEAGMLQHDIALTQFVARKALIYASAPLSDITG